MGEQTFTFLGRVPVKCQPGEVEHSYQPAVSAEGIHEDDTAGHSWGGGAEDNRSASQASLEGMKFPVVVLI